MKKKIYSLLLMLVCIFALSACGEEVRVDKNLEDFTGFDPEFVLANVMTTVPEEQVAYVEHYYRNTGDIIAPQYLAMVAGYRSYQASVDSIGNPQLDESQPLYFVEGKDGGVIAVYHVKGEIHPATIELAYNSYNELQSVLQ